MSAIRRPWVRFRYLESKSKSGFFDAFTPNITSEATRDNDPQNMSRRRCKKLISLSSPDPHLTHFYLCCVFVFFFPVSFLLFFFSFYFYVFYVLLFCVFYVFFADLIFFLLEIDTTVAPSPRPVLATPGGQPPAVDPRQVKTGLVDP